MDYNQFLIQQRLADKDAVYKYVLKGEEKGVSFINIAKTIKVLTDKGEKRLLDLIK